MALQIDTEDLCGSPPQKDRTPHSAKSEAQKAEKIRTSTVYHKQPNLQVALELAGAGFAVFPCRPAQEGDREPKTPRVKEWPAAATRDLDQIRAWWRKWPDSIPGPPTGSRNGLAVLDLDRKHGKDGVAALRALGYDPDKLSPLIIETPGDGLHLYFSWPEGLGNAEPPRVCLRLFRLSYAAMACASSMA